MVKNLPANAGGVRDMSLNPVSGRFPGEGHGNPSPVFLPGKSHEQMSLAGYSPLGHRELDVTEMTYLARTGFYNKDRYF